MRAKSLTLLGLIILASASFTELSNSETLFFDDFEDGKVDAAWKFVHGDWVEENGILSQEDDAAGTDPDDPGKGENRCLDRNKPIKRRGGSANR